MIQLQCLNYIINNNDASFITLNNLDSKFFSDYKNEFEFIKSHINDYDKVPDKETFISKFPNFEIIDVKESYRYLIDELYKDKQLRSIITSINKMKDSVNNNDIDSAINLFLQTANDVSEVKHLDSVDIFKDISRYDAYIERSTDFSKYYVKTGFKELDNLIGGWDRTEELVTIAARTNMGKSWLLLKSAIAAAEQGLTVGLYSGEMSERKVGYRIDTLISHLSNTMMTHGNTLIQNDYKNYLENLSKNMKGTIKVLTPAMVGGPVGVNTLKAFIEKEKLDILCIDQHSLLDDDRQAKNPVDRAANISKDLKNLQVLKKIPIIAVSQQNRTKDDSGLSSSQIAQSDRIGQDSTIIIMFEQKDNIMTMHLVKSRDSVNGKELKYALDLDKGIFQYIPTEGDALGGTDCNTIKQEFEYSDNRENVF